MRRKKRMSVLYRENSGGVVRSVVSGLRTHISRIAELHLYEELRERLFDRDSATQIENRQKLSA
jgi:hypothetical protein